MSSISITRPIDGHCHLREGLALERTLADSERVFSHIVAMPNTTSPICSHQDLLEYKSSIEKYRPESKLEVLYTIYAHEKLTHKELSSAKADLFAVKLYPKSVTTNSQQGIKSLDQLDWLLATLEELDITLMLHGEVNDPSVDIFDRELVFIEKHLTQWVNKYPKLKIVLEHISTQSAVEFIRSSKSNNIAASITAHHLHANRNDLLAHGLKPDNYCLPILKRHKDQLALQEAATSGDQKFYLGTDSAPHSQQQKYSSCGCAGIYTSFHAIELYTEIFEKYNALDQLESFSSGNFAKFHNINTSLEQITLSKCSWTCPEHLDYLPNTKLTPYKAGQIIKWKVTS